MRTLITRLMGGLTRGGLNGPSAVRKLTAFLLGAIDERRRVATTHGTLTVRISNPIERWRADEYFAKEPETIDWLDKTIGPDSVLYDIGANIGLYTLYAAHMFPGLTRVLAFEPEALNHARLTANIIDNGLTMVGALSVGLSRTMAVEQLYLSAFEAGRALHSIERPSAPKLAEWLMTISLDSLTPMLAVEWRAPTHIKIDVDGIELDVLKGAAAALRAESLRHVLVELSHENAEQGKEIMATAGFRLVRVGLPSSSSANHIFVRDGEAERGELRS
jgi:FkbM family methyltransferase